MLVPGVRMLVGVGRMRAPRTCRVRGCSRRTVRPVPRNRHPT